MSNRIGLYKGVEYAQKRICDVMACNTKAKWYFIKNPKELQEKQGVYTGDHYRTLKELYAAIDKSEI